MADWVEELGLGTFCPFDRLPCRHSVRSSDFVGVCEIFERDGDVFWNGEVVDGVCEILECDVDGFETGKVIVCPRFVDLVKLVGERL